MLIIVCDTKIIETIEPLIDYMNELSCTVDTMHRILYAILYSLFNIAHIKQYIIRYIAIVKKSFEPTIEAKYHSICAFAILLLDLLL